MSALPMCAVYKTRISTYLPMDVAIRLENLAEKKGMSPSSYACCILCSAVQDYPLTSEDKKIINIRIKENLLKRQNAKARMSKVNAKKKGTN